MKKDIYIIVMALIIGAMFGVAHIESCAKKRDENRVIVYNISHFETEDIEIEEKTHSIEPVGYEIKTIEDSEVPSDVMAAAEKYGAIYDICLYCLFYSCDLRCISSAQSRDPRDALQTKHEDNQQQQLYFLLHLSDL